MPFRRHRYVTSGFLTLALLGAAAAGSSFHTTQASTARAAHATRHTRQLTEVHFILNWIPNVEFAGLWAAQHFGWFQKAGIKMTYTPYSLSVHPETDVATRGGNTFGFQSGAAIAIARSQGVPIRALFTDTQRSVFGLTVLASSNIHAITDLSGKRVGYQPHEFYVPATMLAYAGLKQSAWKPVIVGYSTDQLTSHQVDAYLTFLNNEPITLALHGVKTTSFPASHYGFQAYDDVMFTTDSEINSNPAMVRTVTSIVARGFAWAHTHHRAAVSITMSGAGAKMGLSTVQQMREIAAFDQFSRDANGRFSGLMKPAVWRGNIKTLFKYGEIKHLPSVSAVFTNQFNPYK